MSRYKEQPLPNIETKQVKGFPEYFMTIDRKNRQVILFNKLLQTSRRYDLYNATAHVQMRKERGVWQMRNLGVMVRENFDVVTNIRGIYAVSSEETVGFPSITEAARWIKETQNPQYSGRPIGLAAIRAAITNSVKQPEVYARSYGYDWRYAVEREDAF